MNSIRKSPHVFIFDLWATVPYYTAYLSLALQAAGVDVETGSITYYLDRECFRARGIRLRPGLFDVVGDLDLSRTARRLFKLGEGCLNLLALVVRFLLRPPDVLHVQFLALLRSRLPLDLYFVRFCRMRGVRLVLTVHDLLPHDTGLHHLQLYRGLYAEMDALICHSSHVRERLIQEFGVPAKKVAVIPHGPFFYDLPAGDLDKARAALGVESGQKIVLWQGIVFPYKGVDLLLNAWQLVEQAAPEATLVVLGTGDPALLNSLTKQAAALGLERVRFDLRFCSAADLVSAYRAASVVVYPYRAITTSGALATGLALGKAIVASDLPVFREALRQEETALLVDATKPEMLARELCRVLGDAELHQQLERNVSALRFGDESWQNIGQQTRAVYDMVLGEAP